MTLQQEIIRALGAKPHINAEEEIRRSVDFLNLICRPTLSEITGIRD